MTTASRPTARRADGDATSPHGCTGAIPVAGESLPPATSACFDYHGGSRSRSRPRSCGAGVRVVRMSVAVVWPAQELEIFEVGGPAVCPVNKVVGLTVVRGPLASGGLAVSVAYDERFPDCRRDGAGRAPDVEDFGPPRDDHSAHIAVAARPRASPGSNHCDGSPCVRGPPARGRAGELVDVDDRRDVRADAV